MYLKSHDILLSLDNNKAVLMVLLDMSAAFNTVDHEILLQRLCSQFGIIGSVNSWFCTYLRDRVTRISIQGDTSREQTMLSEVWSFPALTMLISCCMEHA